MILEQQNVHQDFALLVHMHAANVMLYQEVPPEAFP